MKMLGNSVSPVVAEVIGYVAADVLWTLRGQ